MHNKVMKFCMKTIPKAIRTVDFTLFVLTLLLISTQASAADGGGTNYLSDLTVDAKATFGNGSDLPKYIYGGEAIAGVIGYIKSRSPMVFIGLPVVMMATHFGLKKAFG